MSSIKSVQPTFRIDYRSPEWQAIKQMLEQERDSAIKVLVSPGKTEDEYHQWRGRVSLANKLLDSERTPTHVTD